MIAQPKGKLVRNGQVRIVAMCVCVCDYPLEAALENKYMNNNSQYLAERYGWMDWWVGGLMNEWVDIKVIKKAGTCIGRYKNRQQVGRQIYREYLKCLDTYRLSYPHENQGEISYKGMSGNEWYFS